MSEHAENIIGAVVNQDPIAVKDAFNQAISQKIVDKIATLYPQVAASMVGETSPDLDVEDDSDSTSAEEE